MEWKESQEVGNEVEVSYSSRRWWLELMAVVGMKPSGRIQVYFGHSIDSIYDGVSGFVLRKDEG